ncbi:GtrA family protein, partial [Rhodovulum sulfidophilum]|nr:GtrA family protein [Rhodovulum sulfidophilum]
QLAGLAPWICLAGGIGVSLVTNFLLNRRFTFSYARRGHAGRQFLGFLGASLVGLTVNYAVALGLSHKVLTGAYGLQVSAMIGIAAGMVFNFLGNRYIVFRKRYIRD